jgi:hypothetical protein
MRMTRLAGLVMLLGACSADPNGPDGGVLVGLFGNPDQMAQLVALHESAELQLPCGEYFALSGPIRLAGDLTFRAEGIWHPMSFGIPRDPVRGVAIGNYETATGRVHLQLELGGDDPVPYVLMSGVSAGLERVVCALSARAD